MKDDFFIETLPKSLSKEENMRYFQGHSFYTRDEIIEHNLRLVLSVASRFNVDAEEKKDLISIGSIGLIKAVDSFDVSRGIQFSTFAIRCIQNEILMHFRQTKKDRNVSSLDDSLSFNEKGEELKIIDTLTDNTDIEEDYENKEAIGLLKELVVSLNERDSFILTLYFGLFGSDAFPMKEIGFRLNLSQSYISRLVKKILNELKNLIENPPKKRKRRGKKGSSLFQLLKEYDRSQILDVVHELSEEDRILLYLRCGRDLDNPIPRPLWNRNTAYKFNTRLLPKMKRRLEEKEYFKQDIEEELTPQEKYRREKVNEIHQFLLHMDMLNAQIAIHEYLEEAGLIVYEDFIVSLILLSVMDNDFTFTIPVRSLILLSTGYSFSIDKYKEYFYQALVENIGEARLYLDIVSCLQKAGMSDISVEPLERAYARVLEKKEK